MNKLAIVTVAAGVLAGCSKPPSSIKPTTAVGQPFATYECEQLVTERYSYMERLQQSIKTQNTRVAGDVLIGLGAGLIGLAAAKAVAGQDEEANIGTYRGAIIEIDNESRRKQCTDPVFFTPEPEPETPPDPNSELNAS